MKHLYHLILAAVLAVALPVPTARAEVDVSIDFFFDALNPYGDWIYADDYGYVFQPTVAQRDDWAPYSEGYWAYTDAGWTWISDEDFGWATYHYGRWIRMHGHWVWVPGNEWAPAWVSWRQTDDHVGWAPLPPEARWSVSVGFNQWSDSYYDVGPSYYNFVPFGSFARRSSLRPYIVDRSRNVTYIDRSVNVTNISYRQNVVNNIFVGGPDPDRFDRGDNRVRRLSLRRDDDSFRRDWIDNRGERPRGPGSLSRIERDELVVASPRVRRDEAASLPARIRERFEKPEIDRGWRNAGDDKSSDRLRERQREEFAKAKVAKLAEKTPELITSRVPPPAVGRLLKPEERRAGVQRPDPRRQEEEVRKGQSPTAKPGESKPKVKDEPPAPGDARRPGTPDRDGQPGMRPEGRPDIGPDTRPDGRPSRGPDGRPDNNDRTPGMKPDDVPGRGKPNNESGSKGERPDRRPGVKPEANPIPRMTPPTIPSQEGDRRRGGVPNKPALPKTEDQPPAAKPEPKLPGVPKVKPELPKVRPDMPTNREGRPDRTPEGRRPTAPDSPPIMPKVLPTPEAPKVKPAPEPKAPARPTPERVREKRADVPEARVSKPQAPVQRTAPQVKPTPQPRPEPRVKQAPPKPVVRQAPPKAAPKPVVRQAPPKAAPKPQARQGVPAAKKAPAAKKPQEDERKRGR